MQTPVPYSSDLETIAASEAETIKGLEAALREILDITSRDYGHAVRSVHAKSHGLIEAEVEVLPGLPPELAQGMFAVPGVRPAILRISTNPGDVLRDSISVPRGAALKVLGVTGPRLALAPGGDTQDFLLVNGPAFLAKSPEAFLKSLRLLAKTTDRAEWAKSALSKVMQGIETAIEAVGGESGTLKSLGGAPNVHPLGETYFSQTAFRHGAYVAKYQLAPVSGSLTRLTGSIVDTSEDRDALRHAVDGAMRAEAAEWEFRVQLCRDAAAMPVEDPSVLWDEAASPFQTVARVRAVAQRAWSEDRARVVDDTMRFSVWTGLEAHRPLGAINRVRQRTYDMSAAFREGFNGCPVHEPSVNALPGATA